MHSPATWLRVQLALVLGGAALADLSARTVSIADKGAVAGGTTLNTRAIQAAVDDCAAAGGGTVVVPAGRWLTGSVQLKAHVTLNLEAGAVLVGSPNLADYPPNGFQHPEMGETRSLLWAIGQDEPAITGEGTIELADRPFFDWAKLRTGLPPEKDVQLADWQRHQCVVTALDRPNQPIFFDHCERVRLSGITVRHSSCWTITLSCCEDVQIRGLRIENDLQVPNNDGIHFSGSKNITVSDCIIRGGDDALAFTGITDPASVCENIVVTNCILTSRSAGVRLGHLSGKVRNATLSNLVLRDCNRGVAIQAGDDGWVENVSFTNLSVETRMYAGAWWGKGEPLVISAAGTGRIRGIHFTGLHGTAENSALVVGANGLVSDVSLHDVDLAFGLSPNAPLYGTMFDLAPAPLRPSLLAEKRMPWLYADGVAGLELRDVHFRAANEATAAYSLEAVVPPAQAAR